jgi:hypothetical protein
MTRGCWCRAPRGSRHLPGRLDRLVHGGRIQTSFGDPFTDLGQTATQFDTSHYPDAWRQELAVELARAQDADTVRFDGSDLQPPWFGTSAIWIAMIDYLRGGPDSLDEILERLDSLEPPPTR